MKYHDYWEACERGECDKEVWEMFEDEEFVNGLHQATKNWLSGKTKYLNNSAIYDDNGDHIGWSPEYMGYYGETYDQAMLRESIEGSFSMKGDTNNG